MQKHSLLLQILFAVGLGLIIAVVASPHFYQRATIAPPIQNNAHPIQVHTTPLPTAQKILPTINAYQELRGLLTSTVHLEDPRAAFELLRSSLDDPEMLNRCHALVHELGRTSLDKYNDFATAIEFHNDLCGSGYIHGVVEQHFRHVDNIDQALQTTCSAHSPLAGAGKCYHGIGHGLMYFSDNNVPESIKKCDAFSTVASRIFCSEGVFMENFNSDEASHQSDYLDPLDLFYPCHNQSDFYKHSCYFYAPDYYLHLHDNDYEGALQWCQTAESRYITRCITGVGSRSMKRNLHNPMFVVSLCSKGENDQHIAACIDGMVSYHLVNYSSITTTEDLCATLDTKLQKMCQESVNKRRSLFGR